MKKIAAIATAVEMRAMVFLFLFIVLTLSWWPSAENQLMCHHEGRPAAGVVDGT